jgi:hypothetical protein
MDNDIETAFAARQQMLNKQVYGAVTGQTNTFPRIRLGYDNKRYILRGPSRDATTETGLEFRENCKGICEEKIWTVQLKNLHYWELSPGNDW